MYGISTEEQMMIERVRNFKSVLDDSSNPQYQKLKAIIEDASVRFLVSTEGQKLINEKAKALGVPDAFKQFLNENKGGASW
jgi:hypothetical protein